MPCCYSSSALLCIARVLILVVLLLSGTLKLSASNSGRPRWSISVRGETTRTFNYGLTLTSAREVAPAPMAAADICTFSRVLSRCSVLHKSTNSLCCIRDLIQGPHAKHTPPCPQGIRQEEGTKTAAPRSNEGESFGRSCARVARLDKSEKRADTQTRARCKGVSCL